MNALNEQVRRLRDSLRQRRHGDAGQQAPAEQLIISYPKTGRTWLRMMIGRYLCLRCNLDELQILETPTLTAQAGLKTATFIHDGSNLKKMAPWQSLTDSKQVYRQRRVLLLTRSIEDTMVSAYFQITRRLKIYNGSISDMLRDERYGVKKFITFYDVWYRQQGVPAAFAEVSYEAMHADPVDVLQSTLRFLGETQPDPSILKSAVEFASFDNMRSIERSGRLKQGAMQPADVTDADSHKVRRGVVGGFADYMCPDDVAYIRDATISANCPFVRTASVEHATSDQ